MCHLFISSWAIICFSRDSTVAFAMIDMFAVLPPASPGILLRPEKKLQCQACTQQQLESPTFRYWAMRMKEQPGRLHRKLWEYCYIVQTLYERNMLLPGSTGLGFAIGKEPLPALFATLGCEIVATDETPVEAIENQFNDRRIYLGNDFGQHVRFQQIINKRAIPDHLRDFDFLWSTDSMMHLGNLNHGREFVIKAMQCLRPGGIAVHTTEFNCDSLEKTIESGESVIYRQRDLLDLAELLRQQGHTVEPFDFDMGYTEADRFVDEPPYHNEPHLKLRIGQFASTSFGITVKKQG